MSTHVARVVATLALCLASTGRAEAKLDGHARFEHAVGTEDGATVLSRQELQIQAASSEGACKAGFTLRLRRDAGLSPRSETEGEVRGAQVECRAGEWLWSLGRQAVVWGKADGFPVLDAVHAFDLRELLLQDRESMRRPLTMLRIERRFGDEDFLQALVIPEVRYDRLPATDARFSEPWGQLPALAGMADTERGEWWLRNPQWGAKWEHTGTRLGWTLNALRRVAPQPVFQWQVPSGQLVATAHRQWLFGGSFDLQAGDSVIRGEWLHQPRHSLPISSMELAYASFQSTGWMLGLDQHRGEWLMGVQFFQQLNHGGPIAPVMGRRQDSMTLLVTRSYRDDRVRVRGFLTQDLSQHGRWVSLKTEWQWTPRVTLGVQADTFHGSDDSVYGRLARQSRINVTAQVDF